jgi:signal transduction histidine kinase
MPLLNVAIAHFQNLQRKLGLSPRLRRMGGIVFLLLVGWFDYITPPELASAPFYLFALIPIAFLEPVPVCLAFSTLAAVIYFGADILTNPGTAKLIYPYWTALARLISFGLISSTISLLVGERRRLLLSEQVLHEKAQELQDKNQALEQNLRELKRLQEELVAKERWAATAEAISSATYEIEKPLVSLSVHAEDLLRSVEGHEGIHPLVEKIAERVGDMEGILKNIRELRRGRIG